MVWLALAGADLQEVWGLKSPELDGVQLDSKFGISSSRSHDIRFATQ